MVIDLQRAALARCPVFHPPPIILTTAAQQVLYEGVLVLPTGAHMFERQTVGVTRGVEQHVPEFDVTAKVHISVSGGKTQQQLFETVERRVSPSSEYDKNTAAG